VRRKHRTSAIYAVFSVVVLALCGVGGWYALRDSEPETDGFITGVTNVRVRTIPARAPKLKFAAEELPFVHFPGRRTHRLPEDMGSGVALVDLDGDGDLDLFLVNNGPLGTPPPASACLRNDGKGNFEPVEGAWPALHGNGVAAADYDADGDLDLYVTGYGRNVLLRNDGGLRFTDVTAEAGVAGAGFSTGACWGDADGDGDLDLYVCRYVEFDESLAPSTSHRRGASLPPTLNPSGFPPVANLLFLQEEDGRFVESAERLGVANPDGKGLGALFVDFDGDGKLDLYVANDVTDNVMYRGLGGGRYKDVSHASGTADWRGAMGLAVGDPDNDGDIDMFVTHWKPEENALYAQESPMLFRDDSRRTYLGPPGRGLVGWACGFVDFDADGRPDLYVVNGSTFERPDATHLLVPMPGMLFWNGGDRFYDLAPRSSGGWGDQHVGRGATHGDVDGDGDIDLIMMRLGSAPLLFRNESGGQGNCLKIDVFGASPNVFAQGATVTVHAGGRAQVQVVGANVSYLSSGPHRLWFGIGKATHADRITVRFPSGRTVERKRVSAARTIEMEEYDSRGLGRQMDAARDALATGSLAEAQKVLREIVRLDPRHKTALYSLAQLVGPAEALRLCDRLVLLEPMVPRGHLLRAKVLSDPLAPDVMDLDAALVSIGRARELNREETGGALEEGRVLIQQGRIEQAAALLELIAANPRAAALAALCRYRLGQPERARELLHVRKRDAPAGVAEEGDTSARSVGTRDELARLLSPEPAGGWTRVEFEDTVASPHAVVGAAALEAARKFALDPPAFVDKVPGGWGARCEVDIDGDGDLDVLLASPGHALLPLPWWVFLREGDRFRPVHGARPHPAYRAVGLEYKAGSGALVTSGDGERSYRVKWTGAGE